MKSNKEETRQTADHGCSYSRLHESVSRALPPTAPPLLLPPTTPPLLLPPAGAAPAPTRIPLQPPASWPPTAASRLVASCPTALPLADALQSIAVALTGG